MAGVGETGASAPPAAGVRIEWIDLPERVRSAVEGWLGGRILSAVSQGGGFSPGAAVRVRAAHGRRVFVKAVGSAPNAAAAALHRREAAVVAALPPESPVPRLLWSLDEGEGGWVVLVFEDVEGRQPALPWRPEDLDRVLGALSALSSLLTPSPLPMSVGGPAAAWGVLNGGWWRRIGESGVPPSEEWSVRRLDRLIELEGRASAAAAGETLLHLDLRADNLLLTADRVLVVDWPHARVGAAWLDVAFLAPSVAMQGGPPPDELLDRAPSGRAAEEGAITAVVAAIAGFFTFEAAQPAPPGLPTLRAFQAAQGEVARRWLAVRTGWT